MTWWTRIHYGARVTLRGNRLSHILLKSPWRQTLLCQWTNGSEFHMSIKVCEYLQWSRRIVFYHFCQTCTSFFLHVKKEDILENIYNQTKPNPIDFHFMNWHFSKYLLFHWRERVTYTLTTTWERINELWFLDE